MSDKMPADVLRLTAEIVSAHVANNDVAAEAVPSLIKSVYHSLATAGEVEVKVEARAPAVPVKKSVFPEYIICLEDGKRMKTLRQHLKTSYNLTPDEYRAKWGLPRNYPMVAAIYSQHRSTLAKNSGLGGRKARGKTAGPQVELLPARRARGSKG